jgi:hypothetical protein
LEEHINTSRIAQGEREAKDVTAQEQAELVEQWVIIKMKASQPTLSPTQTLAIKICPKCRKRHAGVAEELPAGNGHHDQDHSHGSSHESSHGSPEQPQTPAVAEPIALEVEPVKGAATIVTSPVVL